MGQIIQGDALTELRKLSSNSIDALCVDPPSGINFMSRSWDSDKGGRDQWVAWLAEIMRECLRVMKPGAHGLVWALPRTSHWTAWALEDAGFEIKDCCYHLFGSGFPKSHDISKAIDRHFQVDREVVGISPNARPAHKIGGMGFDKAVGKDEHSTITLSVPATPEARQYNGFGTALKPAVECWWLIRKPLSEKTIAENVLRWGTGGLAIDACRVGCESTLRPMGKNALGIMNDDGWKSKDRIGGSASGRWPSHLLLSHSIFCVPNGTKRVRGSHDGGKSISFTDSIFTQKNGSSGVGYADADGMEEVEDWICDESCPVRLLDEQSGVRKPGGINKTFGGFKSNYVGGKIEKPVNNTGYNDQCGASRYFKTFHPMVDDSVTFNYNVEKTAEVNQCQSQMLGDTLISGMEDGIENGENRETVKSTSNLNTDGYGNKLTDQYQTGTKYTISTMTNQITGLKTYSLLRKNGTTITTTDSERIIELMMMELKSDGVDITNTGNLLKTSTSDEPGLITDTVNLVARQNLQNGAITNESITENITESGQPTNELRKEIANNRYFQQFYYCSKASRKDRTANGTVENNHPTVKPLNLIQYLCRMICPPGGIVLDCFVGSGTTALACIAEGFDYLLIEQDEAYCDIARARISYAMNEVR